MLYIYESHLGNLYTSDRPLSLGETYCEQCCDSDWLIGEASTRAEAWVLLAPHTNTFDFSLCEGCAHSKDYDYCNFECDNYQHSGSWDYDYVQEFLDKNWSE